MEESEHFLESLNFLWFFSNVFSSTNQPPVAGVSDVITTEEDSPKPTKPLVQTPLSASPNLEIVSPRCAKCGEFTVDNAVEEAETKKRERSRRRKRRSKRKILGELDFGTRMMNVGDFGIWDLNREIIATSGYGLFRSKQHLVNMPPLSDGMAMKEHLKSWAFAVACTVK